MGDYTLMGIVRYSKSSKYKLYFKSHSLTILLKFLKKKSFKIDLTFLKFLLDILKQLIYPCEQEQQTEQNSSKHK